MFKVIYSWSYLPNMVLFLKMLVCVSQHIRWRTYKQTLKRQQLQYREK